MSSLINFCQFHIHHYTDKLVRAGQDDDDDGYVLLLVLPLLLHSVISLALHSPQKHSNILSWN